MFIVNDLIEYHEAKKIFRIIWLSCQRRLAVIFELNKDFALPEFIELAVLENDIESKAACLLSDDQYLVLCDESELKPVYVEKRDKAWGLIKEIVEQVPDVYFPDKRGELVKKVTLKEMVTKKTVYRYLRRYWSRGQTPNALLPNYKNSGAPGVDRISGEGVKKGRPRIFGKQAGVNVSDEIRRVMKVSVSRFYAKEKKFTLKGAYDEMIREFFYEKEIDSKSNIISYSPKQAYIEKGVPSFDQFKYWYNKDNNQLDVKRKRLTDKIYDKDLRGLVGSSTADVWGPGARYQIDATIADVYLVSRMNRSRIIGRPVLYVVIDVFSRMIVGLYVGLEGPSWVSAMMALANTVTNKKAYCMQYGIDIEKEDWPCQQLPATLLGDKGEIEGQTINALTNSFNVTVEVAAAYRADWKGIVEQRFRLLPAKFKGFVPGYIETDYRQRGASDYRLDAVLDLDEFTKIIIECVLYYNNHHEFSRIDLDFDVASDEVKPVPLELWEWGINNRSGSLRQYPEKMVQFSLLPAEQAVVTMYGIRIKGMYYTCTKAIEERWFDKARQTKTWKVKVSFDPRNMEEIYLHDSEPNSFYVCTLTEKSRAFHEMSLWEIEQQQIYAKDSSANHVPKQQMALADLSGKIEAVVKAAIEAKPDVGSLSNAQRTKSIRDNRAVEKEQNKKSEKFTLSDASNKPEKKADVLTFPGGEGNDYSEPDITEILAGLGEDDNE